MQRPISMIRREYSPSLGARPGDPKFDTLLGDIRRHGIREPLVLNEQGMILDGHHRLEVARILRMSSVPVRVWTGSDYIE